MMRLSQRASLWGMAGLTLLAWAVFIIGIGQRGLWVDEWYSWTMSGYGLVGVIGGVIQRDVHPPVYYQALALWRAVTASQDLGVMRLLSAIFALLTVAMTYRAATGWFGRRWVGLGAASALAVSGTFVYFAGELRMYALTAFLVALSWWLLLRLIQGKRRAWLAYGVVIGLMAYTYYFSAFVVVMQGLVILLLFRPRLRQFLLALVIPLLAILPWLPSLAAQMAHEREWSGVTNAGLIGKFGATTATSAESVAIFINTYTNRQPGLALVVVILAIAGMWHPAGRRNRRWRNATIAALFWSLGTVAVFFGLNLLIPVYNPRYPLYALPGLAVLIGAALIWLPGNRWRTAGIAAFLLIGLVTYPGGKFPSETPHAEILARIEQADRPTDRMVYAPGGQPSDPEGLSPLNFYIETGAVQIAPAAFVRSEAELVRLNPQARIWDVRTGNVPDAYLEAYLKGRWLTESSTIDIYTTRLFEPLPDQGASWLRETLQMRAELANASLAAGETGSIKTWWWANEPPPADYSYTLLLRDASDATVAQMDAGLSAEGLATSQWDSDWRFAPLALAIPAELAPGEYSVWLGVYDWRDPVRLPVASDSLEVEADQGLVQLGTVQVR